MRQGTIATPSVANVPLDREMLGWSAEEPPPERRSATYCKRRTFALEQISSAVMLHGAERVTARLVQIGCEHFEVR